MQILQNLHSTRQGTATMQARANKSIYWPGIHNHIKIKCKNCKNCSYNAPSQPKEPLISLPNQNGHSSRYVGIILIIKDMHILQLLIALVDGYAYIILDMDQLLAKTLSPIAGIYL